MEQHLNFIIKRHIKSLPLAKNISFPQASFMEYNSSKAKSALVYFQ